jgi:glutathionyl-hydroquinone reductase
MKYDLASYNDAVKAIKDQVKILNKSLENKRWLVGSRITLADISQFTSLYIPFTFVLDGGIRKAFPLASAWFERLAQQESVIRVMGQVKLCEK